MVGDIQVSLGRDEESINDFSFGVIGGDDFMTQNPEIFTTGLKCRKVGEFWWILDPKTDKPFGDCAFFSEEELKFMKVEKI